MSTYKNASPVLETNTNEKPHQSNLSTEDGKLPTDSDNMVYPSGVKLALILTSIYIGMFLVALVRKT